MHLTLRSKLLLALVFLSAVPLLAASLYFLTLFEQERVDLILAREADALDHSRSRLETVLRLAEAVDLTRLDSVPEILFIGEEPCQASSSEARTAASPEFGALVSHQNLASSVFTQDLDVFETCHSLAVTAGNAPQLTRILPARVPLMVPYLRVFIRRGASTRLALISMTSLGTSPDSTLMLSDVSGTIIWAGDGEHYLSTALIDTGTPVSELGSTLKQSVKVEKVTSSWIGTHGLLSKGLVGSNWILASLAYAPKVLAPVSFARNQMVLLLVGFLGLAILVGRRLAISVAAPFVGLQLAAERVAGGDLEGRFADKGHDEVAAVHRAFNQMSSRIVSLLNEKAKQAELQAEVRVAQEVQKMLLPPATQDLASHRIESFVKFAAACGGDFWFSIDLGSSCLVLIADATGHGVAPALVTGVMRGAVSMLSDWISEQPQVASDPALLLARLNRIIFDSAQGVIMMSAFLGHLDPQAGELTYSNAGHCFPYLVTPEGKLTALMMPGRLLGAEGERAHGPELNQKAPWTKKSRLFLYTDGLTDFPQKDETSLFDRRRLLRTLRAGASSKNSLLRFLMSEHANAVRGAAQADDLTAIVVEAK